MITRVLKIKSVWIAFFVAFIAVFIMAVTTNAQEDDVAKKYNVTFPITQLGGCTDIASCRTFCEDSVNQSTCISYAKQKGFYKEPEAISKKDEIVAAAKAELGCDSESSCRSFCSDQANFDKCDAFAKKRGLNGGRVEDVARGKILEKAKEVLGCSSPTECASFCSSEQNRQKCSEFAKETGLRGGEQRVGPGGCNSESTCKAFCSDPGNFQVCKGFSSSVGGNFVGPGGCNSEESCRNYCKTNPDLCRNFAAQSSGGDTYKKYCEGNPDKCREDRGDRREFEKFCLENPDKCREVESNRRDNYNPREMCLKTPNCKWEENSCRCGSYGNPSEGDSKRVEEYAKFCRENPDKCRSGQPGSTSYPNPTYYPQQTGYPRETYYPQATNYPQATYQPAVPYQSQPQYTSMPYSAPQPQQESAPQPVQQSQPSAPQEPQSAPAPQQQSQSAPQPAEQPPSQPSNPAPVPAVQGTSVVRSIWDRILDLSR